DRDGGHWWLEGRKHARARRDLWRQTRALTVEIGREGEPARLTGEVVVPADSYVRDQIAGIRVDPRLTDREKRAAKLTGLARSGRATASASASPGSIRASRAVRRCCCCTGTPRPPTCSCCRRSATSSTCCSTTATSPGCWTGAAVAGCPTTRRAAATPTTTS